MLRDTDYGYAVARIRCNELKLLTKSDLELLLSSQSVEECMKRLTDKGYGGKGASYQTERELLKAESENAWELINEIAPDIAVFDSLKTANDYHNLKAITESYILGSDYKNMVVYPVTVEPETILEAIKTRNYELLPEHMRECAEKAYTVFVEARDSQLGEAIIDRACLLATAEMAKGCGELLENLAQHKIFATAIKIAVRCAVTKKSLFFVNTSLAPCEKLDLKELSEAVIDSPEAVLSYIERVSDGAAEALREGMSAFEKWSDEKLRDLIAPAKYKSLGPDALAAYLCAKELEIRSVRIILSAKRNGISNEKVRARLRELY